MPPSPAELRQRRLAKLFNLQAGDYQTSADYQAGVCSICNNPPKEGGRPLSVDHCHTTGPIRGLLCAQCNGAIAKFRDDVSRLQRAVDYLTSPPASIALGEPRFC